MKMISEAELKDAAKQLRKTAVPSLQRLSRSSM